METERRDSWSIKRRRTRAKPAVMLVACFVFACVPSESTKADEGTSPQDTANRTDSDAQPAGTEFDRRRPSKRAGNKAQKLPLHALGTPPEKLAELIRAGDVTFVHGGDHEPDQTPSFRPRGQPSGRRVPRGSRMRFDAETNFNVRMTFRSHCRWRVRASGGQTLLLITARFSGVNVIPTHEIWLRHFDGADGFWDSPLIQHEFDHVQLSTQLATKQWLIDDLKQHSTLRIPITDGQRVTQTMVEDRVAKHVQERFAELTKLIEIRYQELDRQTNHGTWTLKEDSELFPLLRETADPD